MQSLAMAQRFFGVEGIKFVLVDGSKIELLKLSTNSKRRQKLPFLHRYFCNETYCKGSSALAVPITDVTA